MRSLPRLFVLSLIVSGATYAALATLAPRYQSEATLAIFSKGEVNPYSDPSRGNSLESLSTRMDKEAINTHVRALQSSDLAEKVVRELKLASVREFNPALGAVDWWDAALDRLGLNAILPNETEESRAIRALQKQIEVYSLKESRSIGIRFTSVDPDLAAEVPNALVAAYREALAVKTVDETEDVQRVLEGKIDTLAKEAAAAEEAVERFRGEANIFKGGGNTQGGLNEQQLSELNAELTRVRSLRADAEVRARQASDMLASGNADALPDVQKSQLMQNLIQSRVRVERQISEASATLLPGHPRMRQLYSEQQGLKRQIESELGKIVESISKEAKAAASREEAVTKSLSEVKTRIVDTGPSEAKLRSLEADAKSKRAELERLRSQYESNRARSADSRAVPVEAQVVSMARPQSLPVFPRKTASALLAGLATLLLGIALVITRNLLSGMSSSALDLSEPHTASPAPKRDADLSAAPASDRVRARPTPVPEAAIEHRPGHLTISTPPVVAMPHAAQKADLSQHFTTKVHVGSADEIVGLLARHAAKSDVGARTLVASELPATRLADEIWNIATAILASRQTLIILDWSMTGDGIAKALEHPNAPGLADLLDGKAKFEDVIGPVLGTEIHMIPAGTDNKSALDPSRIIEVLDALDGVYDHIIVVGRMHPAADLFEAVEGRFDVGIIMADPSSPVAPSQAGPGRFLGFDVEDFDVALYTPGANRKASALPKAG